MGRKIYLPLQIKKADTFVGRFLGLMFRRTLPDQEALWIIPCNSIHMFFMRFAIDVAFLDHQNKIVKLVEHVRPWSMIPPVRHAHSVLEMPVGSIEKYSLQAGDQITNRGSSLRR
jgi:uncharacterized membrane protein (UPF0127 family)